MEANKDIQTNKDKRKKNSNLDKRKIYRYNYTTHYASRVNLYTYIHIEYNQYFNEKK